MTPKMLLIYPNRNEEIISYADTGAITEPLGLEYLAAVAKENFCDVRILDLRFHDITLEDTLKQFKADIVGITGLSMHVSGILEICKKIKELLPDCKILIGGHHATVMPGDFFEHEVDAVIIGEGTQTLDLILKSLINDTFLKGISGIWLQSNGSFICCGSQPVPSLDDQPMPARELNTEHRKHYFIGQMKPIALIRTSLGCPFRCSFCALWKVTGGKYHTRQTDNIVKELAEIQEPFIFLVDDEPFIYPERMEKLAKRIQEMNIHKQYFAYCRISTIIKYPHLLKAWRDIGLEGVFLGIETIFSEELRAYKKGIALHEIEHGLKIARKLGLEVSAGFIVNTNYTEGNFQQLTRFIEHHKIDRPLFSILTPLPGTEHLKSFDKITKLQSNGRPAWNYFDLQHPVTGTVLAEDRFMAEYTKLRNTFASYENFSGITAKFGELQNSNTF